MVEGGLQAFARCGRLVLAQVHIHRPLIAKDMLFDREGVTRAIDDNLFVQPDGAMVDQLLEPREGDVLPVG